MGVLEGSEVMAEEVFKFTLLMSTNVEGENSH